MALRHRKRLGYLLMFGGALVPLAVASVAWACANLATVNLSRASANAGQEVAFVGTNYSTASNASEVVVRFNSRSGAALWSGRPSQNGRIAGSFRVPNVGRGHYVILATQQRGTAPAAGTPGRAPLRVGRVRAARKGSEAVPVPVGASSGQGGSGGPSLPAPATLLTLLLGLGLAGSGAFLVASARSRGTGLTSAGPLH